MSVTFVNENLLSTVWTSNMNYMGGFDVTLMGTVRVEPPGPEVLALVSGKTTDGPPPLVVAVVLGFCLSFLPFLGTVVRPGAGGMESATTSDQVEYKAKNKTLQTHTFIVPIY
eukprot:m.3893 g.3893  ORF g.3893 m.3893 type:complete len:113 (+) comp9944_c0_seq1:220-558(+)